ncbi:class II fumarate hydratase [Bowmanella yangjiangensis]|uniref:Fumarate hydratase class II n=1 Tax=Bowmanella yangjiangensis TaxID=2811230 RepID=A0ABS3CSR4_9ALTE|nr:class II fumarate hydratase [Bowmanella yangjiangensis]MBN7820100.1 class II fumarate hydratase [Bowmanella yangjiangensis]
MSHRIEKDSMGELHVPVAALYQAQTQRAVQNFAISAATMPAGFIRALLLIKQAAARANGELGLLTQAQANAIATAAQQQLNRLDLSQYPVSVFQTGSGTSSNMNANEVLATLATDKLGEKVHPNDHVNLGQSSNDTIPSTIHVSAAIAIEHDLLPAIHSLHQALETQIASHGDMVKTGRTHLMDAMPVSFAQVFCAWQNQLIHAKTVIEEQQQRLLQLAQGGTAVGTGINAHPRFSALLCQQLSQTTGLPFQPADNLFFNIGSQDVAVATSGGLKTLAVALMKIANDLRWMNSGPLAGLAEIELPALQPGSSIMPGKVNPVIPEAVAMACTQVIGHDSAITLAGQSGNFELNVMLPLIASNLLDSIGLLAGSCTAMAEQALKGLKVNQHNIASALARNPILVTALNPIIGYEKAAAIAKQAYQQQRPVIEVAAELTDIPLAQLQELLDPAKLTGQ